jgi:hypothetical protein
MDRQTITLNGIAAWPVRQSSVRRNLVLLSIEYCDLRGSSKFGTVHSRERSQKRCEKKMAINASFFNPYQAPAAVTDEPALAPDTEFLFNDKVVAGVGRIVLPWICVVTGAADALVARESRLWWCSRWITNCSAIAAMAAGFVGIPMLTHLPTAAKGFPPWTGIVALLQLTFGAALCVAAVGFVAATFICRSAVDVRWFVSEKIAKSSFNRKLTNLLLALAAAIACWILVGSRWRGATLMATLWTVASIIYLVRGKRMLIVVGTLDGLFLIGGVSEAFLAETRCLVAAYAAKDKWFNAL